MTAAIIPGYLRESRCRNRDDHKRHKDRKTEEDSDCLSLCSLWYSGAQSGLPTTHRHQARNFWIAAATSGVTSIAFVS